MRRLKPRELRKEASLKIRLTDAQKEEIERAAMVAKQDVSSWIRGVLSREARTTQVEAVEAAG